MANLYDILAAGFPDDRAKPAFILSDGSQVSYAELEAGVAQVAGHLVASGVAPGDRVGLQAEKSVEAVMIYLGVLTAGAVFLPLNAAYTKAEVDYVADKLITTVTKLRELSPLYEMVKEGIDLSKIEWAAH